MLVPANDPLIGRRTVMGTRDPCINSVFALFNIAPEIQTVTTITGALHFLQQRRNATGLNGWLSLFIFNP